VHKVLAGESRLHQNMDATASATLPNGCDALQQSSRALHCIVGRRGRDESYGCIPLSRAPGTITSLAPRRQHVAPSQTRALEATDASVRSPPAELVGIDCWMSSAKALALRQSRWLNDVAAHSEPTV